MCGFTEDILVPYYSCRTGLSSEIAIRDIKMLICQGVKAIRHLPFIYFPTAHLSYTAGSSTLADSATIIADTLNIVGNSYLAQTGTSPFLTLFSGVGLLE